MKDSEAFPFVAGTDIDWDVEQLSSEAFPFVAGTDIDWDVEQLSK